MWGGEEIYRVYPVSYTLIERVSRGQQVCLMSISGGLQKIRNNSDLFDNKTTHAMRYEDNWCL
jgi:hypothetical protein